MRGGVRAFCGAALLCALLAFAAVARAADVEAEAKAEATAQLNAELALEAAEQLQSQMAAYTAQGVASLQAAQVAAGVLSQAEADRGLVVARVVNTRITDRVTADVVARLADDGDDGSGYDEAFAKQASDYSAAAYYDGDPASALNYQANANNFELGAKVSAPYYGGDVSAYTGIDKNRNLIVVGYEGTSNGPKQLAAEGVLGFGRDVPGCPGCKTTQYFGAAQDKLYPQISASVRDLQKKCPTCKVLVTGHSLGGAMAQNGAYQMMKDGTLKTAPTFYTFGQPKTGNPAYNAEFNKLIPNAYRVTHDTDLVPTVGARAKGTNIGTEISYNDAMTSYTKCGGAGCGNKLKSELIKDVKQNAADTFGKPLPTWDQVFSHPFKSAGDVLSRPVDFVKKEVGDVKADVTNSVDQHVKYFGKDLGSEFDSQDPQIKAYQAAQDAKAKQDPAAADAQQQQTRGMPQPLMAMPPGFDGADKDPAAQDKDAKDKPKPALGAAAPGADGKGAKEEKLEDTPSTTPDAVKQLLADDKAKGKAKDKKKSQKQPAKAKAKAKAKGQDKKQPKAKKQKQKANKKQPKKQPKKQAKKQAKKPAKKQQKKRPAKKPKAKKSAAKKPKRAPKRAPKKRAPKKQKRSRAPKRRAPKRAPKRRARAPKRRAPKRRAPKRRAPKRRAPQRRPTPRGSR